MPGAAYVATYRHDPNIIVELMLMSRIQGNANFNFYVYK